MAPPATLGCSPSASVNSSSTSGSDSRSRSGTGTRSGSGSRARNSNMCHTPRQVQEEEGGVDMDGAVYSGFGRRRYKEGEWNRSLHLLAEIPQHLRARRRHRHRFVTEDRRVEPRPGYSERRMGGFGTKDGRERENFPRILISTYTIKEDIAPAFGTEEVHRHVPGI
ncbi:hypothetical protein DFP72DRAFT_169305 [Ephemerocybe angulata]|uniref:Uncharacterized protein n=1 Tax=Ephemerocybe angulata TaxID=980116 RepID=A0A8H6LVX8_9AGAR|nr:hypothetical protein DFP72DRAFT_169305 [Tulosesus angulatus]